MRTLWIPIPFFLGCGALLACDPDLAIVTRPGTDGGSEGGTGNVEPSPTGDASTRSAADAGDGGGGPLPEEDAGTPSERKIDGVNDFAATEKFMTSSAGSYDAFIAWDAVRLYFGMSGPDVGSKANTKWVHVYLGVPGVTGTKIGVDYDGQQRPALPFDATHHLRWKASDDYKTVEVFEGGAWKTGNVLLLAAQQGNFMEMSITRASIHATGKLSVHLNMLIEGGGHDWTFAGVPSASFIDGKDPDFGKYFEFDLADTTKASNTYVAK